MNKRFRFKRIEELFHAARNLSVEDRETFLSASCGDDSDLRAEVESLLDADPSKVPGSFAETLAVQNPFFVAGDTIGPYRIVDLIGEGGMGDVYRAEQFEPLHRQVALKIVKAGMDTRQVLRRFEDERQALALMNHPGIARVFDAGATANGRLYFAMELVEGAAITGYCDARCLTLGERLRLFQKVCEAVQHAHQKGIIHRDLKPSNILVEEAEGQAQPKIIDFGIAKVVAPDVSERTATTRIGQRVGTPEYMSPEQASAGAAIDTRSDVYSLGLVLYELLAGQHPFDVAKLRRSSPDEVKSYLRDAEPEPPSACAIRAEEPARLRKCDRSYLRQSLAGDLDWIVAKALEKEPERRYASASEFSADIGRHLEHAPVLAGSPGRAYRARKFVRRYRWPVATAAAVVLVMLIAIGVVSMALLRAQRAEEDALRQATVANEVTVFLESLFTAADPYRREPVEPTIRTVVMQASERLEKGGIEDAEVYGNLAATLASVMLNQGLREEALDLSSRAVDTLRDTPASKHDAYLRLLFEKSRAQSMLGRYEEARRTADRLVSLAHELLPPGSPDLGVYYKQRGDAEDLPGGTHEGQEFWHRKALEMLEANPYASPEDIGDVLHSLAGSTTEPAECSRLANQALQIWRKNLGSRHPRIANARHELGRCARLMGDAYEAEKHLRAAYELQEKVLGADHPLTFRSTFLWLDALYEMGKFAEAKQLVDEKLPAARRVNQQSTVATLLNQSFTYLPATADFESYRKRLEEAVEIYIDLQGGESEWSLMARHTLADGFANGGRLLEARERYLQILASREELRLPENFFQALLLDNLAGVERRLGLFEEAESHINAALKLFPSSSWDPRYHARAWLSKASLLHQMGRSGDAEAAFEKASEIYAHCEGPPTFLDLRYQAAWHAARGEQQEARELARRMFQMGAHPDFVEHETELLALFGQAGLRKTANDVAQLE